MKGIVISEQQTTVPLEEVSLSDGPRNSKASEYSESGSMNSESQAISEREATQRAIVVTSEGLIIPNEVLDVTGDVEEGEESEYGLQNTKVLPNASIWHPALEPFFEEVRSMHQHHTWNYITPHFFLTFWQLSLCDIYVPIERYQKESQKLKQTILEKDADRSDLTSAGIRKKRAEKEKLTNILDQLQIELKSQVLSYERTKRRLAIEKDHWFDPLLMNSRGGESAMKWRSEAAHQFVQRCLLPRCLISPNDATYCAKYLKIMHTSKVPQFSVLAVYDKLFGPHMATTIFTCTEREAENLGRFMAEVLSNLFEWQSTESAYQKDSLRRKWSEDHQKSAEDMLPYAEFKSVWYKWHRQIWNAIKTCMESQEYMHIRNGLIILERISTSFPIFVWIGANIRRAVAAVADGERREDLRIRALGYTALLNKQEPNWGHLEKFGLASAQSQSSEPRQLSAPSSMPGSGEPVSTAHGEEAGAVESSEHGFKTPSIDAETQVPEDGRSSLSMNQSLSAKTLAPTLLLPTSGKDSLPSSPQNTQPPGSSRPSSAVNVGSTVFADGGMLYKRSPSYNRGIEEPRLPEYNPQSVPNVKANLSQEPDERRDDEKTTDRGRQATTNYKGGADSRNGAKIASNSHRQFQNETRFNDRSAAIGRTNVRDREVDQQRRELPRSGNSANSLPADAHQKTSSGRTQSDSIDLDKPRDGNNIRQEDRGRGGARSTYSDSYRQSNDPAPLIHRRYPPEGPRASSSLRADPVSSTTSNGTGNMQAPPDGPRQYAQSRNPPPQNPEHFVHPSRLAVQTRDVTSPPAGARSSDVRELQAAERFERRRSREPPVSSTAASTRIRPEDPIRYTSGEYSRAVRESIDDLPRVNSRTSSRERAREKDRLRSKKEDFAKDNSPTRDRSRDTKRRHRDHRDDNRHRDHRDENRNMRDRSREKSPDRSEDKYNKRRRHK